MTSRGNNGNGKLRIGLLIFALGIGTAVVAWWANVVWADVQAGQSFRAAAISRIEAEREWRAAITLRLDRMEAKALQRDDAIQYKLDRILERRRRER